MQTGCDTMHDTSVTCQGSHVLQHQRQDGSRKPSTHMTLNDGIRTTGKATRKNSILSDQRKESLKLRNEADDEGLPLKELSELTGRTKGSISEMLAKMDKKRIARPKR